MIFLIILNILFKSSSVNREMDILSDEFLKFDIKYFLNFPLQYICSEMNFSFN
jgi:hypothetical protein